ncbi:substrate-binding domain-containing protein [Actinomadura sp. 9N215]|uniref:substrate-binding domain-containing protein n=1 Tax=Actinomadura sp. 9N215 TaxID=3375150 RepID=UPI0037939BEB
MSGRTPGRPMVMVAAAIAGVLLLTGVGAYAFAEIAGCASQDRITLDVAAAPEIVPALAAAIRRFDGSTGTCAGARLRAADPAAVSTMLSGRGGGDRPDVWIPDSTLWTAFSRPAGARPSIAGSPVVLATAAPAEPTWNLLLGPSAATAGGRPETGATGPRPQVPDPARNAVGLAALLMADRLLAEDPDAPDAPDAPDDPDDPDGQAVFTGLVRAIRETTTPTVEEAFATTGSARDGAVVVASEQTVLLHNRKEPGVRAYGAVPKEGTLVLDYPFMTVTGDGGRAAAAKQLEREFRGERTRTDLGRQGFRVGRPAPSWTPAAADVRRIAQSYARLSLPTRLLVLFDVSGSMGTEVSPGLDRLQATAHVGQTGLQLLADDSELGVWEFAADLRGSQDWAERVPIAPLGARVGSVTQRQRVLSDLGGLRVTESGDTALFETLLAAFRTVKLTFRPEMVNTVLVFTDGRNDHPGGPSFERTLADLRAEYDATQPVQVVLQGFGDDVDVTELTRLAEATHGIVQVARTPAESKRLLLEAMSRRVCTPNC